MFSWVKVRVNFHRELAADNFKDFRLLLHFSSLDVCKFVCSSVQFKLVQVKFKQHKSVKVNKTIKEENYFFVALILELLHILGAFHFSLFDC